VVLYSALYSMLKPYSHDLRVKVLCQWIPL